MLRRLRGGLPPFFQIIGFGAVAVGLGLIFVPAGVIAAGLGLFLVGFILDNRRIAR